jgi:CheY-like chemotaxis protein
VSDFPSAQHRPCQKCGSLDTVSADTGEGEHLQCPHCQHSWRVPRRRSALAAREGVRPSAQTDSRTATGERRSARQVLLVDDDAAFTSTLAALLVCEGFTVVVRTTCDEAIRELWDAPPHVLITDLRVGQASGWAVARFAQRHRPELPVIVVTGWPEDAADERDRVCAAVFTKPFEPDELLQHLRTVSGLR